MDESKLYLSDDEIEAIATKKYHRQQVLLPESVWEAWLDSTYYPNTFWVNPEDSREEYET